MKKCNTCKKRKPAEEFSKNRTKWDGLQSSCKECAAKHHDKWVKENPEYYPDLYKKKSATEEGKEEYRRKARDWYRKNRKS
ncbi:hypothetical protein GTY86_02060 [Streptomyces sp. SID5770]|uniref:hypothetical protein n=1 Tax=Streptomyces sp. SID5770 TaxID=2690308 RepID=UPI00136A8D85|nr:hypothetical protein [Streptomyces sp. SID5770]MZE50120.1 hypothetical protein [Streptomyces sp. SID5770]